jgi:hypothetical protein
MAALKERVSESKPWLVAGATGLLCLYAPPRSSRRLRSSGVSSQCSSNDTASSPSPAVERSQACQSSASDVGNRNAVLTPATVRLPTDAPPHAGKRRTVDSASRVRRTLPRKSTSNGTPRATSRKQRGAVPCEGWKAGVAHPGCSVACNASPTSHQGWRARPPARIAT